MFKEKEAAWKVVVPVLVSNVQLMNVIKIGWQHTGRNNYTIATLASGPKGKKTTEGSQPGSRLWVFFWKYFSIAKPFLFICLGSFFA